MLRIFFVVATKKKKKKCERQPAWLKKYVNIKVEVLGTRSERQDSDTET